MQVNSSPSHPFPAASRYTTSSTTVASAANSNKTCTACSLSAPKSNQIAYSAHRSGSAPAPAPKEVNPVSRGIEGKTNPWLAILGF